MTRSTGEVGPPSDRRSSDHDARVRVEFAAPAAEATPLAELGPTTRDLTRVQPLLEQLAAAVASLLSTDMAIVWTTDPSEDLLLPSAWVGFPEEYVAPMRVPYGTGSAGRAVLERRTVLVEDIATSDHYGAYAKGALEHGVRTVLSVPMLTLGGAPMGALTTYYRSAFAPDERDLEVADVYARQAAEIVERARLHAEARQLAALEQRRSAQLSALARSALALSATDSQDQLVELVTEAAVDVIGCHQGVTSLVQGDWARATTYVALSDAYEQWHDYREPPVGLGLPIAVTRDQRPLRLTGEQLLAHPDYRGLRDATGHPPLPDYLAAPLIGRDGSNGGLIQLSHKKDGTSFTAEDEAMLVQLAQMASATVERIEAFAGERRARREAEQAALLQGVLSDASGVFAESFDPRAIGSALVQLVVPRLATVSVLHLVDEAGDLVMDACSAGDVERLTAARAFFGAAPVPSDSPYGPAAVLRSGQPQVIGRLPPEVLASVTADGARAAALATVLDAHTMSLPLMARGRTLGVLSLSRETAYDDGDLDHALDLSRRAALALDNASRYAFERDVAVTLQHSLLPRALTGREGLTAAARYLPGARGTRVGGDWYDVLEVDGKVVLVVGDVMGRGIEAAAVMGQLRATVRAYALEGHPPAEVLTRLDQVVLSLTGLHFSTCIVALLDPVTRAMCVACAGHLPPLIVAPGGGATVLEVDPGLPLGVGGSGFVQQTVQLPPGALVLLYTDGLVESRDASLQEGIDRLVAALGEPVGSADEACDRALEAQGLHGDQDDDTAVLAVLLDPAGPAGPVCAARAGPHRPA
jgi:GAF domain-containing protein